MIDAFDRKILAVLQEDARITQSELAAKVGLSPTPCTRRIKRMEEDGVIDRYVTLVNPKELGLGLMVFVNVRLHTQAQKAFDLFEKAIKKMPEVVGCYLLAGSSDYLIQVRVADIESFRNFIRDRLIAIEGIGETQSSIVLEQVKNTTSIPVTAGRTSNR